jgi:UTP--glucose-1-phosphate uridylyltransferase
MPDPRKITKAVIPAAGFGTRMLPATKAVPKEMLPVAGKPLIQYSVEEAVASGIETIVLVVRGPESLIHDHFSRDHELESFLDERHLSESTDLVRSLAGLAELRYVEQKKPLGLAHAISCARPVVGEEPFAVLLPDVIMAHDEPVTRQLVRAYEEHGGSLVAVRDVEAQDVRRFGIVRIDQSSTSPSVNSARLTGLVEKPSADQAPSRLGIFGRYLLAPQIWDAIAQTSPDARGEIQLTDALDLLCRTEPVFGFHFAGQHYDAGDRFGYLKSNIEFAMRNPDLGQPLREYLSCLQTGTHSGLSLDEKKLQQQVRR